MSETRHINATFFSLEAEGGLIETVATAWCQLGEDLFQALEDRLDSIRAIVDDWEGSASESWREHHQEYCSDLDAVLNECKAVGCTVDAIAASISTHQGELTSIKAELMWALPVTDFSGGALEVEIETEDDRRTYESLVGDANDAHDAFIEEVRVLQANFEGHLEVFDRVAANWLYEANVAAEVFDAPDAPDEAAWMLVDGTWVFNTGSGNNDVEIRHEPPPDGPLVVVSDGVTYPVPDDATITIRTGDGNDTISVPEGTNVNVTILAGDGDDTVNFEDDGVLGGDDGDHRIIGGQGDDRIEALDGSNYVSAGSGDNYVETNDFNSDQIRAGDGDNIIYALGGYTTTVSAGEGNNYIEGGGGASFIHTGSGDSTISGGASDDLIITGTGENVVYAGAGQDTVFAGDDGDRSTEGTTVYGEASDRVSGGTHIEIEIVEPPDWIGIEGSPEFTDQIRADLAMLGSSPVGQEAFANLTDSRDPDVLYDNTLVIRETDETSGHETRPGSGNYPGELFDRDLSKISVNHEEMSSSGHVPSTGLFHEMAHAWDEWNGMTSDTVVEGDEYGVDSGWVSEAEYRATGLPFDHDGDPSTPIQIDPEFETFNENALRDEMGRPLRETYIHPVTSEPYD